MVVIAVVVALAILMLLLFWYGLRGKRNEEPAIGTNRPWPDGLGFMGVAPGSDDPPYLPTGIVSPSEEFRRDADRILSHEAARQRARRRRTGSWMEQPGALEREGLVD